MGIKHSVCCDCEWIKETKKENCNYPAERGRKMSICPGQHEYYPLWKEARDMVNKTYSEKAKYD